MNKTICKKTAAAVLAAVLAGSMMIGCTNEPEETNPSPSAVTTVPTTVPATVPDMDPTTVPTTVPVETEPMETLPIETEPQVEAPEAGSISYEEYLALDVDTQQAYYDSFENPDDFFTWLADAQAAYEATKPTSSGMEEGVEDWE